eukprot:6192146-Pleurochrysis_carterae.AAC.4
MVLSSIRHSHSAQGETWSHPWCAPLPNATCGPCGRFDVVHGRWSKQKQNCRSSPVCPQPRQISAGVDWFCESNTLQSSVDGMQGRYTP